MFEGNMWSGKQAHPLFEGTSGGYLELLGDIGTEVNIGSVLQLNLDLLDFDFWEQLLISSTVSAPLSESVIDQSLLTSLLSNFAHLHHRQEKITCKATNSRNLIEEFKVTT